MKRRITAAALVLFALGLGAGSTVAGAEPSSESPIGGDGAHVHHVHTGDGCHDLDQHLFEPRQTSEERHRGLHQGAIKGQVHHGRCSGTSHQ